MNHFNRAELALLLEQLKQAIKQHEEQGKLLDKACGNLLLILSGDKADA